MAPWPLVFVVRASCSPLFSRLPFFPSSDLGSPSRFDREGMANKHGEFSQKIDYVFKVVLIGDSAVGKSQLLARFARNEFSLDSKATIGVEFQTRTLTVDHKTIKAQIWDTAGQERYRAVTSAYYRGAGGQCLFSDMTKRQSNRSCRQMVGGATQPCPIKNIVILIGNKSDLSTLRAVPTKMLRNLRLAEPFLLETSALESTNVETAFMTVLTEIYRIISKKSLVHNDEDTESSGNSNLLKELK
ncbi:hypothetical protein HPP92_017828 [Vanilla planifolia]|uniref:Uncharacterized protein n=1 Tax=Vanilla planifolia TaxID=51239 RepID=A0A835QCA4_VANPL|nr:hypothetical protein HPP92_017828 [Vanilla planifolia]